MHQKTPAADKHTQHSNKIQNEDIQNLEDFLYTNNKHKDKEIRTTIPVTITSKIT